MYWENYGSYSYDIAERNRTEDYDYNNGRWDIFHYMDTKKKSRQWSDYIQEQVPCQVKADENRSYGTSHEAADYPVYLPGNTRGGSVDNRPSPSDNRYFYANSICMNRNRDLNGDGAIQDEEVRWFLPTSSIYQQISVSQGELPDPIFKFGDHSRSEFADARKQGGVKDSDYGSERYGTYNYHYISADFQYFFAEEFVSTGNDPFEGWGSNISAAYTVRCVRNLGTNPGRQPKKDVMEVENGFEIDTDARIFTQSNFTDETLRGSVTGGLAPHDFTSPAARMAKKFQYAKHVILSGSDGYISFGGGQITSTGDSYWRTYYWTRSLRINGICGKYTEEDDESDYGTWRVPSAGELALMWIANLPQDTPEMESGYISPGTNNSCYLSATHDYFYTFALRNYTEDNQIYLGYNDDGNRKVLGMDVTGKTVRLRCVRDVD
jgi:hypothetical protein